jgi:hypothetical protein
VSQPLLGEYVDPSDDSAEMRRTIEKLEQENRELHTSLIAMQRKVKSMEQGLRGIRRQLEPWHNALGLLFGELDEQGISDAPTSVPTRIAGVWESWKQKLGGKSADLIDALLQHGVMNAPQLRVAMKCHINSVYETTAKLQKLGLVNKNGGRYSLKEL